jgi:two-component system, NtrC family, sensor kinase
MGVFDEFLIYILYLFYGLAFFTIGVSIISRDKRFSQLQFARHLWLLAAFAFIHGLHEWLEVFFILHLEDIPRGLLPSIILLKLFSTLISFIFLLAFGLAMLNLVLKRQRFLYIFVPSVLAGALAISLAGKGPWFDHRFLAEADLLIRYFIALPAAFFSGLGFLLKGGSVRHLSDRGAFNFRAAGVMLLLYGIFAGLIPSGTSIPPLNLPVELFRGLSAFVLLHFLMSGLHIFDIEWKRIVEDRLNRFSQSEKFNALGKLAAGIAHEINNPLANIQMNVELLKGDLGRLPPVEIHQKRLAGIERNVTRASKIARELLVFSRESDAELVPTDIGEVIDSTLLLLGPRLNDYVVVKDYHQKIPGIMAIPWKVEEVFINMLINAIDATPPGGALGIRTWHDEMSIFAEIKDSGSGISGENLGRIFDPFFTTKEVGKGTGLGLSICLGIMEAHGGRIEVASEIDEGTRMTLVFPIGEPAHA